MARAGAVGRPGPGPPATLKLPSSLDWSDPDTGTSLTLMKSLQDMDEALAEHARAVTHGPVASADVSPRSGHNGFPFAYPRLSVPREGMEALAPPVSVANRFLYVLSSPPLSSSRARSAPPLQDAPRTDPAVHTM